MQMKRQHRPGNGKTTNDKKHLSVREENIMRKLLGLLLAVTVFAAVPQAMAQEKLTLWFNKGFYPAEDEALNKVIAGFEKKTGVKIELSLFGVEDIITKSVSAVEAKTDRKSTRLNSSH